jgi:hypothetical protein
MFSIEPFTSPMNYGMHKVVMSTLEFILSMLMYVRCSIKLQRSMI